MGRFDDIIDLLVDEFMAHKVDILHQAARENYRLTKLTVATFHEFLSEITRYYLHHFNATMGDVSRMPPELATSNAQRAVERAFRGGLEEGFLNAQTGTNGGLRGVIERMAEFLQGEMRDSWVNHVNSTTYDPFNFDDMEGLAREFLSRYGAHLPAGAQSVSPASIAGKIRQYLESTAQSVSQIRRGIQKRY